MNLFAMTLIVALSGFVDEPKSGALLQTLPEDGTWTSFNATVTIGGKESVLTWTARSVGKVLHGGKACRWIELEQSGVDAEPIDPALRNVTWRLLIPEEEFGEGKHPLGGAVKTWVQYDKGAPKSVESIAAQDPIFGILIKGPLLNLKAENAKEKISWQQGDLECSVYSGKSETEFLGAKLSLQHRLFRHPKVPFGIAGMHQELAGSLIGDQTVTIHMSLRDHGKDARAKLPDLPP